MRTRRWGVYVALLLIGLAWAAYVLHGQRGAFTDWLNFEIAARSFIHFQHNPVYAGNPFGIYARDPVLQIGPPSWLPLTLFQSFRPWHVNVGFVVVMVLLGVGSIAAIDATSRPVIPPISERARTAVVLVVGAGVMVVWSYNVARWHHLDDAIALSFSAFACLLIQRRRAWWLVGLLLGTAVAAKPWALILAPVLLGLPRESRSKTALVAIAVAGAWWAPFVLGASGTIHALGEYQIPVRNGSVWWLLGLRGDVHGWLRPVQFIGGVALGVSLARRGGSAWLAAPLAALAFRVLTDPYTWTYYGMGPVLFALLWDLVRPGKWTRLPVYSAATLLVEGLIAWFPVTASSGAIATWYSVLEWSKLAWGIAVIGAIAAEVRTAGADRRDAGAALPAAG